MFDDFFEKNPPIKSETADKKSIDNIKAAVLKGISEDPDEADLKVCGESEVTPMKKRNIARSLIIAAAVAALGTMSIVSANAVTDNLTNECISNDDITNGKKEIFNIMTFDENGEEILIARDYIEWVENKDGSFDIWYEVPSETAEALSEQFDYEYKNHSPEELSNDWESLSFNGEPINSESENTSNGDINENWEKVSGGTADAGFDEGKAEAAYYFLNENGQVEIRNEI